MDVTASPDLPGVFLYTQKDHYGTTPWKPHYNPKTKHLFTTKKLPWKPVPRDIYGLKTVEFLTFLGASISHTEIKVEHELSLCGKYTYYQAYRVDTHLPSRLYKDHFFPNNQHRQPFPLDLLTEEQFRTLAPSVPLPKFPRRTTVHLDSQALYQGPATIKALEWDVKRHLWIYILEAPKPPSIQPLEIRAVEDNLSTISAI